MFSRGGYLCLVGSAQWFSNKSPFWVKNHRVFSSAVPIRGWPGGAGGAGAFPNVFCGGLRCEPWNLNALSDQNLWFIIPYFRSERKIDTPLKLQINDLGWSICVNLWEYQYQARVKIKPISEQNAQYLYPFSVQNCSKIIPTAHRKA